jgi:alkylated DNA repair dioxygenase AlkB
VYYAAVEQSLISFDGELVFVESFIADDEALRIHRSLLDELAWEEESIRIYGRPVKVPRLTCWYGEPGAVYTYSGVVHDPLPWTALLNRLRRQVEALSGRQFNSVLGNLYRDGNDSMGWHGDKEKELGPMPFIASLSFGERRTFKIRHNRTKETVTIDLSNGSLLLMGGVIQKHWRHCVPKTKQAKKGRINLTFRNIILPARRGAKLEGVPSS